MNNTRLKELVYKSIQTGKYVEPEITDETLVELGFDNVDSALTVVKEEALKELDKNIDVKDSENVEDTEDKKEDTEDKKEEDIEQSTDEVIEDIKDINNDSDVINEDAEIKKEETEKIEDDIEEDNVDTLDEKEVIFEDGWYNIDTDTLNYDFIKNPDVVEAIKLVLDNKERIKNNLIIEMKLTELLDTKYKLAVRLESFKKLIDLNDVKIVNNEVHGLIELLDKLKETDPGLFRVDIKTKSPIHEGFNPVFKKSNTGKLTIESALNMMTDN